VFRFVCWFGLCRFPLWRRSALKPLVRTVVRLVNAQFDFRLRLDSCSNLSRTIRIVPPFCSSLSSKPQPTQFARQSLTINTRGTRVGCHRDDIYLHEPIWTSKQCTESHLNRWWWVQSVHLQTTHTKQFLERHAERPRTCDNDTSGTKRIRLLESQTLWLIKIKW
jgi:hypothetical protein